MHEDRDNYIIFITLLPLVLFVALYATWRSAGEPSFGVPNLPLPAIPLAVIPELQIYIPSWLSAWLRNVQRNGDTIFPAIALGIFMGVVGMGTLMDAARKVWNSVGSPRPQREVVAAEDHVSPPVPDRYSPHT